VQIHVCDNGSFRPYATYLALVAVARRLAGEAFAFRTERYEFVDHIPAFDLLTGDDEARQRILARDDPRAIADDLGRLDRSDEELAALAVRAAEAVAL
jgi:uncharacterized protein YbbC (DUF1343 family)